jgi:hypothetical protein
MINKVLQKEDKWPGLKPVDEESAKAEKYNRKIDEVKRPDAQDSAEIKLSHRMVFSFSTDQDRCNQVPRKHKEQIYSDAADE